jgi:hypothetical protein
MSIHEDITAALSGVAGGKVYTDAAPQDSVPPFVIFRRKYANPLMLLSGPSGEINSGFEFQSWGSNKTSAITLSSAVVAAIESAAAITTKYQEPVSGEEFEPTTDQFVETVQFSFWHT